jgi:hypothetical protein
MMAMKVSTILAKAATCKSKEDAERLLDVLERVFGNAKQVAHLPIHNREASMEGDRPFVRFELNREISEHYVTMIRPEIRYGQLVVVVATNQMLDGLGMESRNWETVDGMEDVIEARPDQSVADMMKLAVGLALADHAELITCVGVPSKVARLAAKKSW